MPNLPPTRALLFCRHRHPLGKSVSAGILRVTLQGPGFFIMPSATLISCFMLRSFQMENSPQCRQMELKKLLGLLWLRACTPPSFCPIKWWETCLADFTGSPSSILICFESQVLCFFSLDKIERITNLIWHYEFLLWFALQYKTEGSSFIPFDCIPIYILVYHYTTSGTGVPTELKMTGYVLSCLFLGMVWLLLSSKSGYLLRQKAKDLSASSS